MRTWTLLCLGCFYCAKLSALPVLLAQKEGISRDAPSRSPRLRHIGGMPLPFSREDVSDGKLVELVPARDRHDAS